MNATNFRLTKITKERMEHMDGLRVDALYDMSDGFLRDRSARLEVIYKIGKRPELVVTHLDMAPNIPTPKSTVNYENGLPVRVHTYNPYPSMDAPKDSTRKVNGDYLRGDLDYRAMIGLIPDSEPIKPALEDIVR